METVPNKYVIMPTPAADDVVWGYVVGRSHIRRSLDGTQIVAKWPVDRSPHWAMVQRLGGTVYTCTEVRAVLAGPEWTEPSPDLPLS